MMTRRARLLTVEAILVAILILLIGLFFFLRPADEQPAPQQPTSTLASVTSTPPAPSNPLLEQEQIARNQAAGVTVVAKLFVERYGSYSNEANFKNLFDVLPLMTNAFAQSTRTFIETAKAPSDYYGVSTRVVTVKVEQMDEANGTAMILVNTQRESATGSTQNTTVSYQEIRIKLVRESGVWKVDSAAWL